MNELILVVDDEPKIVKLARDYLEQGGFRVLTAADGMSALAVARRERPDLIVLDLKLPGKDGLDVCRTLRRESDVPIIMLTARVEETDRLVGLELGADDYITKPFSPRELVARVRAVLRRVQGSVRQGGLIQVADVQIDLNGRRVSRQGEVITLTRNEFNLLVMLAQHPGQAFTREQLLTRLYDVAYDGYARSIDAHIKNLRQKLEIDPSAPRYVLTVFGVGYKWSSEAQRRNLTADVAHELRTPLSIMQGNLEGLLDGVYQPTAEHLHAMLDETHWLSRLIDDLRLLSLAESGQLVLHTEAIAVDELLTDLSTSFGGQAEAAGIQLCIERPDRLAGVTVNADVGRLSQVLGNLVVNALRYTPPGGTITLQGERVPGSIHLIVRDTGKGIASRDLPFIFDRFWRGDPARSRAEGAGGGLGLAIARQLVLAHGGRIEVESQPGQGTTFLVQLPTDA